MTARALLVFLVVTAGFAAGAAAPAASAGQALETVPAPCFDCVAHDHPERFLDIPSSAGSPAIVREVAAKLAGAGPREKLSAIGRWIRSRLRDNKPQDHYHWRTFEQILQEGDLYGCADNALVFGLLARASGIPTIWVKTMEAGWIREFVRSGTEDGWRGHVFLEVFLDGRWRLLDASTLEIYEDYATAARILPGGRFAYDKGGDPYGLVLSPRWEEWKVQTRTYFAHFDVAQLPVTGGRSLQLRAHVVADAPVWQWLAARCGKLGYATASFNVDFERKLAEASGGWLIVTALDARVVLPKEYWSRYLPFAADRLEQELSEKGAGRLEGTSSRGDRVTVLFGRTLEQLKEEVDRLDE